MHKNIIKVLHSIVFSLAFAVAAILLGGAQANAQCNELMSDLQEPLGIVLINQGNPLVAETGATVLLGRAIPVAARSTPPWRDVRSSPSSTLK